MGGSPISSALDTGGGSVQPNFASSAQSSSPVSTTITNGGSTGPTLYLGNVGPSSSSLIVIGVGVLVLLFFLFRGR